MANNYAIDLNHYTFNHQTDVFFVDLEKILPPLKQFNKSHQLTTIKISDTHYVVPIPHLVEHWKRCFPPSFCTDFNKYFRKVEKQIVFMRIPVYLITNYRTHENLFSFVKKLIHPLHCNFLQVSFALYSKELIEMINCLYHRSLNSFHISNRVKIDAITFISYPAIIHNMPIHLFFESPANQYFVMNSDLNSFILSLPKNHLMKQNLRLYRKPMELFQIFELFVYDFIRRISLDVYMYSLNHFLVFVYFFQSFYYDRILSTLFKNPQLSYDYHLFLEFQPSTNEPLDDDIPLIGTSKTVYQVLKPGQENFLNCFMIFNVPQTIKDYLLKNCDSLNEYQTDDLTFYHFVYSGSFRAKSKSTKHVGGRVLCNSDVI